MIDYKKIKGQLDDVLNDDKDEKEENQEGSAMVKESKPLASAPTKTVVYDELPSVTVTYPDKPNIELPSYEKIEYTPKADEEIEKIATEDLEGYKTKALESFDKNLEATKQQKEQEKVLENTKKTQNEAKVDKTYEEAEKEIGNNMLKQGMTNSSTATLLKEKNDSDKADALKKVAQNYSNAIAQIDNEIAKAEAKRQQAINNFNVTYALKYAERVDKLKKERENAVEDALKYNNELERLEFKDKVEKEKTESKLYSEALDQFQTEQVIENKAQYEVANSYNYRIYTILRKQLAGMSKEDAYNAVRNDPTYAENLTTSYYLQLVDEFGRDLWVPNDREYGVNLDEK